MALWMMPKGHPTTCSTQVEAAAQVHLHAQLRDQHPLFLVHHRRRILHQPTGRNAAERRALWEIASQGCSALQSTMLQANASTLQVGRPQDLIATSAKVLHPQDQLQDQTRGRHQLQSLQPRRRAASKVLPSRIVVLGRTSRSMILIGNVAAGEHRALELARARPLQGATICSLSHPTRGNEAKKQFWELVKRWEPARI